MWTFFKKKQAPPSDATAAANGQEGAAQAGSGRGVPPGNSHDCGQASSPTGSPASARGDAGEGLPLSYARPLSWLSLVIILLTSLVLSFFISNSARETLLTRQEGFARLLVENLNSQIFRRFALPTLFGYGRISLRQPAQYDRLDQVVQSVIHGLPVERLRIYDFSRIVAYSTRKEEIGRAGLSPANLDEVLHGAAPKSEIISTIPAWQAPFRLPKKEPLFSACCTPCGGNRSSPVRKLPSWAHWSLRRTLRATMSRW